MQRIGKIRLFISLDALLSALLLAFFIWHILSRAPQEELEALSSRRAVLVSVSETAPGPTPVVLTPGATVIPPPGTGLKPAPEASITEQTELGALPKIAADGTRAWQYYGRAFTATAGQPVIAVMVVGLGFSRESSDQALHLAPEASLSLSPYVRDAEIWAGAARAAGHEVLVDLPLEPEDYPATDPGPHALLTAQTPETNEQSLRWVLTRFPGYVGVTAPASEHFIRDADAAQPVLQFLAAHGLMLALDSTQPPEQATELLGKTNLPYLYADIRLDAGMSHDDIATQLLKAERIARAEGHALLVVRASPVVLKDLSDWLEGLGKKGIILAPVSALARLKFS